MILIILKGKSRYAFTQLDKMKGICTRKKIPGIPEGFRGQPLRIWLIQGQHKEYAS